MLIIHSPGRGSGVGVGDDGSLQFSMFARFFARAHRVHNISFAARKCSSASQHKLRLYKSLQHHITFTHENYTRLYDHDTHAIQHTQIYWTRNIPRQHRGVPSKLYVLLTIHAIFRLKRMYNDAQFWRVIHSSGALRNSQRDVQHYNVRLRKKVQIRHHVGTDPGSIYLCMDPRAIDERFFFFGFYILITNGKYLLNTSYSCIHVNRTFH